MKVEEFIKFLEDEKLKDILYKKLEWQSHYIPNSYIEVGRLLSKFGKQPFLSSNVEYYANRKKTIPWQIIALPFWLGSLILCAQLNGKKNLLAFSGWTVLSTMYWYAWWPELVDSCFTSKIKNYVKVYNEEVILESPRNEGYSGYVESIRGLVSASEFDMHLTYLKSISSKDFEEYREYLLTTILTNHKEVRERFLEYVEALRSKKVVDNEFEVHVSRLREYSSIKIDKEKKYRHVLLFSETKKFFWNLIPFDHQNNNHIENLYGILSKIDYEKATLEEVLKPLGLLELVDDYNVELIYTLKQILFQYHPDRNKHEKAKEIFTLINENINNPILIILEDFELYTNFPYTTCLLDEFLHWRIEKIKEIRKVDCMDRTLKVYNHLLSKMEPNGNFYSMCSERNKLERPSYTFTMENYRGDKEDVLKEKDKILGEYRKLMEKYIMLGQKKLLLHKKQNTLSENIEMQYRKVKKEAIEELSNEIKNDEKLIVAEEKSIKKKKEEMRSLVEWLMVLYEPMIENYKEEIDYLKDVCVGKIDFEKQWKISARWDQEEVDRCRRKIRKKKLSTFIDERRVLIYQKKLVEIKEEKEIMEGLLTYLTKETKYVWDQEEVDECKEKIRKEKLQKFFPDRRIIKLCQEKIDNSSSYKRLVKHHWSKGKDIVISKIPAIAAKVCPIFDYNASEQKGLAGEYINICKEYENLKSKLVKRSQDIMSLNIESENLKNRFKTEEEKLQEKVNGEKSKNKKELLILVKRRKKAELELVGAKVKNEKIKQENEEIKQRNEIYKNLLLQIKNGELPISRLKEIDIDSLIAGSSSQTKNEDLPISRLEEVDVKSFIAGPSWQR